MRNNLHLKLLFNFVEKKSSVGEVQSFYKILYFFSDIGPVSPNILSNLFKKFSVGFEEDGELCFKSLDELGEFAVEVCVELAAPEVFILSNQDYNIGLDSCNDVRSFKEVFRRYGTCVMNPQSNNRKKNLFNKLFD